jgi:hypothetical protein
VSKISDDAARRAMGCLRHGASEPLDADRAALEQLRPWLEGLPPQEQFDALEELARVACFLELSKKSPGAASALLDLVARVAKAEPGPAQAAR